MMRVVHAGVRELLLALVKSGCPKTLVAALPLSAEVKVPLVKGKNSTRLSPVAHQQAVGAGEGQAVGGTCYARWGRSTGNCEGALAEDKVGLLIALMGERRGETEYAAIAAGRRRRGCRRNPPAVRRDGRGWIGWAD